MKPKQTYIISRIFRKINDDFFPIQQVWDNFNKILGFVSFEKLHAF